MVQWSDYEDVLMNECYIWMQAHVSDRGILHFTVRFLLYEKHFLPNWLLRGMFLKIIFDLIRQFDDICTCCNFWTVISFQLMKELFCFLFRIITSWWLQYWLYDKKIYGSFSQVLPLRICSWNPRVILWTKITTYNNSIQQKLITLGTWRCVSPPLIYTIINWMYSSTMKLLLRRTTFKIGVML